MSATAAIVPIPPTVISAVASFSVMWTIRRVLRFRRVAAMGRSRSLDPGVRGRAF